MYELIWSFFINYFFYNGSDIGITEGLESYGPLFSWVSASSSNSYNGSFSFSLNADSIAVYGSHILTVVTLVLLFVALVNLIKGLFKVIGGGFKW